MARAQWIGLCTLLCAASAAAESVTIELSPRGTLSVELTADSQVNAASLGIALSRSLGCRMSNVAEGQGDGEWFFRGTCTGPFQRYDQVLAGYFKLALFRQALIATKVNRIDVDLAVPSAPYSKESFPRGWESICSNGVVHHRASLDPHELPVRPIRVAAGYRKVELLMLFGPIVLAVFLAFALVAWLNLSAAEASQMDGRALWFAYLRALAWGLTGLFLLWAAIWASIKGDYGGETDVWALYSLWNGGSAIAGRLFATSLFLFPALLAAVLSIWWVPPAFAAMRDARYRVLDTMKMFLMPALALTVPATWTLDAFGALGSLGLWNVFSRIYTAVGMAMLVRWAARYGRSRRTSRLTSGEVFDRLTALAPRCRMRLKEIEVASVCPSVLAEPIEAEAGRLVLTDYVLATLTPAEIEAEVARRWSLPLHRNPDVRRVLMFSVALGAGMLLSLVILAVVGLSFRSLLHTQTPKALIRMILPETILWSLVTGRFLQSWLGRRADRLAAALVGGPEAVTSAAKALAPARSVPWQWAGLNIPAALPAPAPAPVDTTSHLAMPLALVFSSSFRSTMSQVKAVVMMLAVSIPPIVVALAARAGLIPAPARWLSYLAGMAMAILCRSTFSKVADCLAYRRLQKGIREKMPEVESAGSIFVGLSPVPRPMVYDGTYDWDVGFLTLFADRLDYRGEQAQFTLRREQVRGIHIGEGAPHWSDPYWVYVSWSDNETGKQGTFPLILPNVRSPWKHRRYVGELLRTLTAWKDGALPEAPGADRPPWGVPALPDAGVPLAGPAGYMAANIALCGVGTSLLTGFPLMSEATLYFLLVWSGNVVWDLFGHKVATSPSAS